MKDEIFKAENEEKDMARRKKVSFWVTKKVSRRVKVSFYAKPKKRR